MPAIYYYPDRAPNQQLHVVILPAFTWLHRFELPVGVDGESLTGKPSSDRSAPEERVRITVVERMDYTDGLGNYTWKELQAFIQHLRRGASGLFMLAEDATTAWARETTTTIVQGGTLAVVPNPVYNWMPGAPTAGESVILQSMGSTSEAVAEPAVIDAISGGGNTLNFAEGFRYSQDETPVLIREAGTHLGLYLRAEDYSEGILSPVGKAGLSFRFDLLARVSRYAIREHMDHAPSSFADSAGGAGATFQSVL